MSEAMYLTAPASAVPPYGWAESLPVDGQAGGDGPSAPFAGVSNDYIISSIRSSLSFMGFLVSPDSIWWGRGEVKYIRAQHHLSERRYTTHLQGRRGFIPVLRGHSFRFHFSLLCGCGCVCVGVHVSVC